MFAKVLGAVLVLVTLAACAPTPAGPTTPVVPAVPAEQLALPFDRYRPGFADESEVQRARTALVRDCLRDLGVRLDVPDDVRVPGVLDLSPNLRRYGVVDDPTATDFGYHFPRTAAESERQQEQQRWSAGLTQAQRETLFGEHGCTGRADRELGPVDDGFLTEADFQSLRTSGADPRVAAVTALWRTCMDGLGFDYADPTAAISDPRWDLDSSDVPAAEIGTARADVRCKASARFVEVWHEVEVGVQQAVVSRDAERFASLATAREARRAAARRVLGA